VSAAVVFALTIVGFWGVGVVRAAPVVSNHRGEKRNRALFEVLNGGRAS